MDMPKPGEPHRIFESVAGRWEGEEKMYPQPWAAAGAIGQAQIVNRLALSGFAVIQDYVQYQNGQAVFEGHGVLAWDDGARQYVMHWWDSMGMPPNVFRGGLESGVLVMTSDHPGGKARATWDFREKDHYTFRMEMAGQVGAWSPMMEGSYRRAG